MKLNTIPNLLIFLNIIIFSIPAYSVDNITDNITDNIKKRQLVMAKMQKISRIIFKQIKV